MVYCQTVKNDGLTYDNEVTDYIAPHIKGFCQTENIDWRKVVKLLLDDSLRTRDFVSFMPFTITSDRYITGNYGCYRTKTPLIYEMKKIDSDQFIVLFNKNHPELILDKKANEKSEWEIAVVDRNYRIVDEKTFFTQWKYDNEFFAVWDWFDTSMGITGKTIIITISYLHIGSGGGRDQQFTVKIDYNNKINKIVVQQTIDFWIDHEKY
jgi:hypothetical protein